MVIAVGATVAAVAKQVLTLLLGDEKGRKFLLYVVGITLFILSIPLIAMLGLFGNPDYLSSLSIAAGAYYLMAALPIALAGYFSAVRQGRVSASGINLLSKRPGELGKAITSSALVETYAIFALLITLLLVFFSPFNA